MTTTIIRGIIAASLVALGACAAETVGDYGGSPGASPDAAPAPSDAGGNVSFGGAGDIGQYRGALENGQIPTVESLDSNGFFNEHYVPPVAEPCTGTICATVQTASTNDWFTPKRHVALRLALRTNLPPTEYVRKPLNLVVVVDHSGSMASDGRLDKVKTGLVQLVNGLRPEDRMAIVAFDDDATLAAPFTTIASKERLLSAIASLQPEGSTNIYAGLDRAFAMFPTIANEAQNRVILLSDGVATAGNTSTPDMIALAERNAARGIGVSTVGVGLDFDPVLMRGVAERGAGAFYFAEDAAAVDEIFTKELSYSITPLALDIQLRVEALGGYQLGETLGTNYWQHDASGSQGHVRIPAVFVASRDSEDPEDPQTPGEDGRRGGGGSLFIHLIRPAVAADASGNAATVTVTYRLPTMTEPITQVVEVAAPPAADGTGSPEFYSDASMQQAMMMYHLFRGLRQATELAHRDLACALTALYELKAKATAAHTAAPDFDIRYDLTLIDLFIAVIERSGAQRAESVQTCSQQTGVCLDRECPCDANACQSTIEPEPDYGSGSGSDYPYDDGFECGTTCNAGSASGTLTTLLLVVFGLAWCGRRRHLRHRHLQP